ncbi:MBL fold metallo-hydrolase [Conexibacter sp. W3-3-2]|uniref:MBL fold metallo-hydrolase n=1 Tax=Conexibacter sp. W3-3-2 TaxID=2675227 RepID=UPI0012B6FBA1|nr:MBL fold metallo-hydrolase [Conexibacter sp. W3-3-2]MTD45063.1 MBL fold metallo-hydrolase [Conexibacter sp. W3-3-2]
MEQIAPDVFRIPLLPRDGVNAYIVGDVLVDAGMKGSAKKILKALDAAGVTLSAHVITHAHGDHVGGTPTIVDATGVPVSVGAGDRAAAEAGEPVLSAKARRPGLHGILKFAGGFDGFSVDHSLTEGDDIGCGFTVLETPGHSPGHVSFWRESDGVLICGDVVTAMHLLTTKPGLHQPPALLTPDPERNRESERRLAGLEPQIVLAGHGPPVRDAAQAMRTFVAGL